MVVCVNFIACYLGIVLYDTWRTRVRIIGGCGLGHGCPGYVLCGWAGVARVISLQAHSSAPAASPLAAEAGIFFEIAGGPKQAPS